MENIDVKDLDIQLYNVLVAVTSPPDWDMNRIILLQYRFYNNKPNKDIDYVVVEGFHCSCYGFDEIEWIATGYKTAELNKLANAEYNNNDIFWELVKEQINEEG